MVLKIIGSFVLLLGLGTLVAAAMAYSELRSAATSETAPSADSMPLAKVVIPELFEPGGGGAKPATLAGIAFNRIYIIAGVGIVMAILGGGALAIPRTRRAE